MAGHGLNPNGGNMERLDSPDRAPELAVSEDKYPLKGFCHFCRIKSYCLPAECSSSQPHHELDSLVQRRRVVHKHQHLFRQHEKGTYLLVLSSGTCKSYFVDAKSREHICGFFYPGDLIGTEALYQDSYQENSMMLETGCVCYIPISHMRKSLAESPELLQQFMKMLSQQLWQEYKSSGCFSAEERVLQFLLVLGRKQKRLGYSDTQLRLRMSRNDIANYLGLRSETVSRVLTRLDKQKLLKVHREQVDIVEPQQIQALSGTD